MPKKAGSTLQSPGAQTLRRGLSILKLLACYQPEGLGVSDIARKLNLNKATAVRLTQTLKREDFVAQDSETKRYQLGPISFAVGLAAEPNYVLQRIATPGLRAVALETGDWVFFIVRHGLEAVCLSRESGTAHEPQASLRVGDRYPLGLGAAGLAILAFIPKDEADEILSINAPVIAQLYPKMTLELLRKLLYETRERGYSSIPGTIVPGYWGIGVPVLRSDEQPVAALVLIAKNARLTGARQAVIAERLYRLSREIMLTSSER